MLRPSKYILCALLGMAVSGCGGAAQKQPSDSSGSAETPEAPSSGCTLDGVTHEEGSSFPSSDGCNTCSCSAGGVACTERACAPKFCGARAGDTCAETEFCAYVPGEYCGAADAQSHCKPRPSMCDDILAPVCGCDGKTYENACVANRAGQGIKTDGECPPSG